MGSNPTLSDDKTNSVRFTPSQIVLLGYLFLIISGTFLLCLPIARTDKFTPVLIDNFFTASSAVCVTGLVVVDISKQYTVFGQVVVLVLIQLGGLGYMTVSSMLAFALGKRISLKERIALRETIQKQTYQDLLPFVKYICLTTLIIELFGTLLLSLKFVPCFGFSRGIYFALFHSISAFCNAGFSLFSTSFMNYAKDLSFILVICGLIILGGIGYITINNIQTQRRWSKFSLNTKIVLTTTICLLAVSTVAILLLEFNTSLEKFKTGQKFLNAFFQAVTSRTAGFNTMNIGALSEVTLFLIAILMFIGASPGGTGGGIKTTTFATALQSLWSTFRTKKSVEIYHRRLPQDTIHNAFVIIFASILWICFITIFIQAIENEKFINTLFEVTSAFGTVGLSTGNVVNNLSMCFTFSPISKLLITLTMLLGRVGSLTFGFALIKEIKQRFQFPEEKIMIG
ncbi:MAG: TrkH family potassium uptake protein [Elusimicrobiota bacterium]|nr:TrkH family potassium uptake protein [Elusimicrobiota bacterium]